MNRKKVILVLAICSMSIFSGCSVLNKVEEKFSNEKAVVSNVASDESIENLDEENKKEKSDDKDNIKNEEENKETKNTEINDEEVIKKVQEYVLEGNYEKGLEIIKGLIFESNNTDEEAKETYGLLKEFLTFGASILTENLGEMESLIEEIIGESIDINGDVLDIINEFDSQK